jgi:hypothetical protein
LKDKIKSFDHLKEQIDQIDKKTNTKYFSSMVKFEDELKFDWIETESISNKLIGLMMSHSVKSLEEYQDSDHAE